MSQAKLKGGRASSTAKAPKVAKLLRPVLLIFTSAEQGENPANLSEFSLRGKNNYFLFHSHNQLKRVLSPFRFDCLYKCCGPVGSSVGKPTINTFPWVCDSLLLPSQS